MIVEGDKRTSTLGENNNCRLEQWWPDGSMITVKDVWLNQNDISSAVGGNEAFKRKFVPQAQSIGRHQNLPYFRFNFKVSL